MKTLFCRSLPCWVVLLLAIPVVVWTAGREGDLLVPSATSNLPQKLAEAARDPMVSSAANGEGPVIACEESKLNGQPAVLAARVEIGKTKSQ